MPRIHSDPSPSGVVLSGTLRAALVEHTKERMRHFFLFLYTYRMLMAVLQCTSGTWAKYVSVKATHQIDVGLRRDEGWDIIFKDADASVLDLPASAFKSVDASHFAIWVWPRRWQVYARKVLIKDPSFCMTHL